MDQVYHIPVLPDECIQGLNISPGDDVVDATYGGGGHSRLILQQLGQGRLFAFDQDEDAAGNAPGDNRLFFIRHNFRYLKNFLRFYKVGQVDAILADLGVSSHDFDDAERGFSFRHNGALDMRMNRQGTKDAASVINNYSAEELKNIFSKYGEIKNAGILTKIITEARRKTSIKTTIQLKEIISPLTAGKPENKFLAKVFQALRIEVNDEIEALKEFLPASLDVLKKGGRLAVISFHSLEDRICKHFLRSGNFEGKIEKDFYGNPVTPFKLINRKVISPGKDELISNPRSRSAKLRIAEKL